MNLYQFCYLFGIVCGIGLGWCGRTVWVDFNERR